MRVAYVSADPGVPVFGRKGASVHVQGMLRALLRRGAEVHLLATRFDGEPPADLEDVRVHRLPSIPKGEAGPRELAALAANGELRSKLATLGPLDLVYERYSLWSHAGIEHARETGAPAVLEVNAPLIEEHARHRGLVHRSDAEEVARRAMAAASAVVAVSDAVGKHLERSFDVAGRVHVIPNGVDPERFPARLTRERAAARRPFTIGFLGTLKPWHGLEALVEAFAIVRGSLVPDARLLLVGEGPERGRVGGMLAARGLDAATTFAGAVAPEHVPHRLAGMDVGVAPYPALEDFYFSPLKVLEYMGAGLPVVASRVGQVPDLVEDGRTGLLCPPADSAALAAALGRLAADPDLARALGAAGRERVLRSHTWDAVCERALALAGAVAPEAAA